MVIRKNVGGLEGNAPGVKAASSPGHSDGAMID